MKKFPARGLSLALLICSFVTIGSLTATAVPITLSLDNAIQSTAAPSVGAFTLTFTGTVTVDSGYHFDHAFFDAAFNSSHTNSVTGSLDAGFAIAWNGVGTYTGALFTINVFAGTPADLYAFQQLTSNPSLFYVFAAPSEDNAASDVKGEPLASASQAYSVNVTNGFTVPDNDVTLILLAVTAVILYFARRMFLLKAWPTTG
jgi:hypothetical protein